MKENYLALSKMKDLLKKELFARKVYTCIVYAIIHCIISTGIIYGLNTISKTTYDFWTMCFGFIGAELITMIMILVKRIEKLNEMYTKAIFDVKKKMNKIISEKGAMVND